MEPSCRDKLKVTLNIELDYIGTCTSAEDYIHMAFIKDLPITVPSCMAAYTIKEVKVERDLG